MSVPVWLEILAAAGDALAGGAALVAVLIALDWRRGRHAENASRAATEAWIATEEACQAVCRCVGRRIVVATDSDDPSVLGASLRSALDELAEAFKIYTRGTAFARIHLDEREQQQLGRVRTLVLLAFDAIGERSDALGAAPLPEERREALRGELSRFVETARTVQREVLGALKGSARYEP